MPAILGCDPEQVNEHSAFYRNYQSLLGDSLFPSL